MPSQDLEYPTKPYSKVNRYDARGKTTQEGSFIHHCYCWLTYRKSYIRPGNDTSARQHLPRPARLLYCTRLAIPYGEYENISQLIS